MGKLSRRFGEEITLYVRQLAWLHAAPRPDGDFKFTPVSRMRRFRDDGRPPPLPPCPWPRLVDQLLEAGPIAHAGQGRIALTWCEIDAWAGRTRKRLRAWDAKQIHALSGTYLAALVEGEAEDCPPFWWPDDGDEFDPVEDRLEQFFNSVTR